MGNLYNLLHGMNPDAPVLLAVLNIDSPFPNSVLGGPYRSGRFRDAYLNADGTRIILLTRNGGANREHWANDTEEPLGGPDCTCAGCTITYHLPKHPNYIRDWDDTFDNTYAYIEFSVPAHAAEWMKRLATGHEPPTLRQKFENVNAELDDLTPQDRIAKALGEALRPPDSSDQPQSNPTQEQTDARIKSIQRQRRRNVN